MAKNYCDPVLMGQRIKEQRKLKEYTREKLSEMADITPRFCYDLELGCKKMSLKTLCRIASALSVTTDYLIFGTRSEGDEYIPITALVQTCPPNELKHLEQIVSHYIQAVRDLQEENAK